MKLSTKYFGEIEYSAEDTLHFQKGLFAFEEEKEFLLLPFADSDETLLCLQSVKRPELAFVAMNPFILNKSYEPVLQPDELSALGAEDSRQLCFYVLCAVKSPAFNSTVNLKCPVAVNDETRQAMQVILEDSGCGMRHPLSEFGEKGAAVC